MRVELLVHLEMVSGATPPFVWWAESPQVPGLSVAADHLPDLLGRATQAVQALLSEQSVDISDLLLEPVLSALEPEEARGPRVANPRTTPDIEHVRRVAVFAA